MDIQDRTEEYKQYRLRVRDCHDCADDVEHAGHVKSVPAYFHPTKCEVLVVSFTPEEADHRRQQATLFTGEEGKALADVMNRAGLSGDSRIGFTSLIKCRLTRGNVKKRVCKACTAQHFAWELEFVKPKVLVLLGEDVIKFLTPDYLSLNGGLIAIEATSYCLFDQWYVFAPSLASLLNSNGKNAAYKLDAKAGQRAILQSSFDRLKELL